MAYVTGSAADMTALMTALRSACTANGWTLAGDVLHRGNVYVRTQVVSNYLTLLGGTGIDGSNNLTGAAGGGVVRVGRPSTGVADISWPITYHIFIGASPDEVYLVASYNIEMFQFLAFGQSSVTGLPGTGVWFTGSLSTITWSTSAWITITSSNGGSSSGLSMAPWWTTVNYAGMLNQFVHHGLDALTWNTNSGRVPSGSLGIAAMTGALPNAWNSEAVLLPIQVWLPRSSGNKVSLVADLAHARYLRVDNHNPGDIITIGSDAWMVFPFYQKNATVRAGGSSINHTGTFGWAIRYDGP
jgi:hypothetical protein